MNRSRQLALDGAVDTNVDSTSNDAGSSPAYYPMFSSVFFLLLFTTLSYKTPIAFFEWRWQSDFGVSILVTTVTDALASTPERVTIKNVPETDTTTLRLLGESFLAMKKSKTGQQDEAASFFQLHRAYLLFFFSYRSFFIPWWCWFHCLKRSRTLPYCKY